MWWDVFRLSQLLSPKGCVFISRSFSEFPSTVSEIYALDPAHYYSLPGLTFDAALKYSKKHLELIKDERIYGLIEDSIRGGVSFVGNVTLRQTILIWQTLIVKKKQVITCIYML